MFIYTHLSRRGIHLPRARSLPARVLLGVVAAGVALVAITLALMGAVLFTAWALVSTLLGRRRPAARPAPSATVGASATVRPAGRTGTDRSSEGAVDVGFRELP